MPVDEANRTEQIRLTLLARYDELTAEYEAGVPEPGAAAGRDRRRGRRRPGRQRIEDGGTGRGRSLMRTLLDRRTQASTPSAPRGRHVRLLRGLLQRRSRWSGWRCSPRPPPA